VKSGYYTILNVVPLVNPMSAKVLLPLKKLWKSWSPNKQKSVTWHVLLDAFSSKTNVMRRGMQANIFFLSCAVKSCCVQKIWERHKIEIPGLEVTLAGSTGRSLVSRCSGSAPRRRVGDLQGLQLSSQ
jgi:hypothetical protein